MAQCMVHEYLCSLLELRVAPFARTIRETTREHITHVSVNKGGRHLPILHRLPQLAAALYFKSRARCPFMVLGGHASRWLSRRLSGSKRTLANLRPLSSIYEHTLDWRHCAARVVLLGERNRLRS
jgi:hypothetical protein